MVPRQQTFSAARQGEDSPRTRTESYHHECIGLATQTRAPSDAGSERPRVAAETIRSLGAKYAGSEGVDWCAKADKGEMREG